MTEKQRALSAYRTAVKNCYSAGMAGDEQRLQKLSNIAEGMEKILNIIYPDTNTKEISDAVMAGFIDQVSFS